MRASNILLRSSRAVLRRSALRPVPRSNARLTPLAQLGRPRPFASTTFQYKGMLPDSSDPAPPKTEAHDTSTLNASPADLSDSEYHEIADKYLDTLVLALEEKAEAASSGLEVEYSAGVLTVTHSKGTYVINKQPPNKQIWLSSPFSGPKRYDWVVPGAAQHEKEGSDMDEGGDDGSGGKWVYLRDGSTLSQLLKKELDIVLSKAEEGDVASGKEGPSGGGKLDGD